METQLLEQIEQYLVRTQLSPTRFGRIVVRDPRFVEDLRAGRQPRQRTMEKVSAYLKRE
jgi:2,4-dienoyl-CoA reductase-like NADH-dependent reductase (Old Yellow Enzyme family)